MIRKETYTQNNINPDICDGAILYADREPTEEELFYINMHRFDKSVEYAQGKNWKLVRANTQSKSAEGTKASETTISEKICLQTEMPNNKPLQSCEEHSGSLDGVKAENLNESCSETQEVSEENQLEIRMKQIKEPSMVTMILPILVGLLGLVLMVLYMNEGSYALGILTGIILSGLGYAGFSINRTNYKLAKSDLDAYKRKVIAEQDAAARKKDPEAIRKRKQEILEMEYAQAVASQQASEPWTVRYSIHPCPYCGHYKVRSAKWQDKQVSVAFWGAASSAIDKHYKCEFCKKMW